MFRIQNLTADAKQKQTLTLPDGTQITISLFYSPQQEGWFFSEILYLDFRLTGVRICTSPNLLYQFRNLIPFGIACFTVGNREPTLQDDFLSLASELYVLTESEVDTYTRYLNNE